MANRRIAKGHRLARKKRLKTTKKSAVSESSLRVGTVKHAGRYHAAATRVRVVNGVAKEQQHRFGEIESLKKQRSKLLRQQVAERMVLKEHMRDLEARKARIRRGETAKTERRELAKYIRQLKQEQQVKHASELSSVEAELKRLMDERDKVRSTAGKNEEDDDWEDIAEVDEEVDEDNLQRMFAHLTV